MTNEYLLNKEIYCPEIIDLRIVVYLKLGFKVLFKNNSNFLTAFSPYILLIYQPDLLSNIKISKIININQICDCTNIRQLQRVLARTNVFIDTYEELYFFDDRIVHPVFIGNNQILELETYIITKYENKDR